ncbi:hypothetical protein DPMN_070783 [Dreissena polymorpha]|uniref:Uncharacterized protein n=1 Tax=Dreissena polymorpha TaxID=45954 RepID=A0A9D3Z3P7_DREPO|nr:hypothetical protein DPMN_070783 [Dreissena polymorpha]
MGINNDRRRPITSEILFKVIQQLPNVCYNSYEATLFAAIFSLVYFGLFRISELVSPKRPEMYNQIRTSDVELSFDQSYISIRIAKSKTLQHNASKIGGINMSCPENARLSGYVTGRSCSILS